MPADRPPQDHDPSRDAALDALFGDDVGTGDAALDGEFPLGDGVAELDAVVLCPYCGEPNDVALDPGGGERQAYVEDCQVCCQPWHVSVRYRADGTAEVRADPADGR